MATLALKSFLRGSRESMRASHCCWSPLVFTASCLRVQRAVRASSAYASRWEPLADHIQMLIVGQTARILLAGILPGAILSILAVRAASHFLYGSVSANSLAIIAASLVLAFAGSVATLIPARRAALADPLETLRSE